MSSKQLYIKKASASYPKPIIRIPDYLTRMHKGVHAFVRQPEISDWVLASSFEHALVVFRKPQHLRG